ncbi:hypothetical protein [Streptomyces malaysiensis]|uniref:hypothetical protein n=1 Tax=Streptomyces malaysiensis TaxID=92644 RepID=UPI0036B5197A
MDDARRREIRRIAHDHAARQLGAALSRWDTPARLFADEDEQVEFEVQVIHIMHRLEAEARK